MNRNEPWHNYYDIFIRNAFGNYRDVLQQVSWNPVMAEYLTFLGNQGLEASGSFPDENYVSFPPESDWLQLEVPK